MTRETVSIACPNCECLCRANHNFCAYCGAALNGSNRRRDYECAVGAAILALDSLESDVYYLLDILGVQHVIRKPVKNKRTKKREPLPLEGAFFSEKIDTLEYVAHERTAPSLQTKLQEIVTEARRLGGERNNFAHGLLWVDGFTGEHKRTFVRRGHSKGADDPRAPELIDHIAYEIIELALKVRDLAMELGGLERWEKFYDEEITPLLAFREKSSDS